MILGYVALTLTEVDTGALPARHAKRLPRIIPGVRLGRQAVSRHCIAPHGLMTSSPPASKGLVSRVATIR